MPARRCMVRDSLRSMCPWVSLRLRCDCIGGTDLSDDLVRVFAGSTQTGSSGLMRLAGYGLPHDLLAGGSLGGLQPLGDKSLRIAPKTQATMGPW